ncbi:SDR family oxidoreductase [Sphaerisporangium viridialbum]|uniref:SDR family oxidoreductase n=1 Tax=Sphaerisporangium viridialbum TaxID=46189 RepID=UPI003C791002
MTSPRQAALVTGGSSGIGLAVATALVARGFEVTVLGRDAGRLGKAVDRLGGGAAGRGSGGPAVHGVVADVAKPGSAQAAVAAHIERWGRLDVLVNSAGVLAAGPLDSYTEATVAEVLDIDLRATIMFCQAALPYLRKAARDGGRPLIANIASVSGKRADPGFSLYCAAKFGVVGFTAALHQELRGEGVGACAVCPGLVDTPMADWARSWAPRSSMLRPEDVAGAVLRVIDMPTGHVPAELSV